MYIYTLTHTHIHIYTYTQTHTHIHIYTYTVDILKTQFITQCAIKIADRANFQNIASEPQFPAGPA